MPTESTGSSHGKTPSPAAADVLPSPGLSPAERVRVAQCFQRGTQSAATNLDYAIEMFSICVLGDPANAVYLQALLGVLKRKYAGRKGIGLASLWTAGSRAGLKKLATTAQWRDVLRQGLEIVKANPSDHDCLLMMADACGYLMMPDTQAVYLRAALDAAPLDPNVNRQCARFAANQGQFDQAIECWRRISRLKGLGEEADREIARLSVEKTIVSGQGMVGRPSGSVAGKADAKADTGADRAAQDARARIEELQRAIVADPTSTDASLELADLLEREGRIDDAETLLARALAASGNDLKVREHVEDRQLRWARQKVLIAEKRVQSGDSPEARATLERLKAAQLRQEIQIYSARCDRYPEHVGWKHELAIRLKTAGNYSEAIRYFQAVLQDSRLRGAVSLELGECFQKIRQYQLAMSNYQAAVESLGERDVELKKRALYRAGVLATGLNEVDVARKHLETLAALDFGYRDVRERLDKLGAVNDNRNPAAPG